jgi:hypothetical protein
MLCGIAAFVVFYARQNGTDFAGKLVTDIYFAIGAHALLMVVQFFVPDLRDAMYRFTFADQALEVNQRFRMAGLTNGGGAQLSIFQSAGLVFWPVVVDREKRVLGKVLVNVIAMLIFASLVLSGRSGILLAVGLLPVVIYLAFETRHAVLFSLRNLVGLAVIAAVTIGAFSIVLSVQDIESLQSADTALTRSLDLFSVEDGRGMLGRDDSNQFFSEHFFLPSDWSTLVFGDPYLFEQAYAMHDRIVDSDSGYITFVFGYGVIGSLPQYAFYLLLIWFAIRHRHLNRQLAVLSALWAVAIICFHVKEILMFSRIGFSITVLLATALAVERVQSRAISHRRVSF